MPVICSDCGAENAESSKYCTKCGTPLPIEKTEAEEQSDRFQIVVAFLIAAVSIIGAFLAFRITMASGNAANADVSGIVSSVNQHQARVASEAVLFRDLRIFLEVQIHDRLSEALIAERDLQPYYDPSRDELWDDGWTETRVAEGYLDQINLNPEYLRSDGSYDAQAFLDIEGAGWALKSDFDRQGHFSEADQLRAQVMGLMGATLLLTVSLFFYTLAEIVNHGIKYLFVVLGSGFFVIAIIAALAIELPVG